MENRFCSVTLLIQIIGFFKCFVTHSLSLAQLRQIAEGKFYFKWVLESLIDRRKVESLIDCKNPSPKYSQRLIKTKIYNVISLRELTTGKLPNARESAGDQVLISFRLASDWFRAWREFLHQSQTEAKRNQNKSRLLSTINWKLL